MPGPIGLHPPQGPGRGTQTVLGDPNQPELPAQGENHPVTGPVNAVGDDSLPAFTRALTSGPLLRGYILHVGIGKEVTGVGQKNLMVTTILVKGGEPQGGHQVLRSIGAQEEGAGAVSHCPGRSGRTKGEPQCPGLHTREVLYYRDGTGIP